MSMLFLWQRYSATYRPGIYTTAFSVVLCGHPYLEMILCLWKTRPFSSPCGQGLHVVSFSSIDIQQALDNKENVPTEEREWISCLDHEEPPELPHIKEEQEKTWKSQDDEHEGADIIKFTFGLLPWKNEESEEEPHTSQLTEQKKQDDNTEVCGKAEPARNCCSGNISETITDDSVVQEEFRDPQSGLSPLQSNDLPVYDEECNVGTPFLSSSECTTSFDHDGRVQNHKGHQPGSKPCSCSFCGKRYIRKDSLAIHTKCHSEGKSLRCSVCNKSFQVRRAVVKHMRTHTGEKPFSCSVCGVQFAQTSNLLSHFGIHTGVKPFTCSVCKKTFRLRKNLGDHMRIHTGEKPFSCSVCGKRFAQYGHQIQHMRIHTGEKPFSCSVCGKTFAQSSTLNKHLRVHTGEKHFMCSICKVSFSDRATMLRHMTVHTRERPYSCSVCDKRFTRLAHVKKHKCVGVSSQSK